VSFGERVTHACARADCWWSVKSTAALGQKDRDLRVWSSGTRVASPSGNERKTGAWWTAVVFMGFACGALAIESKVAAGGLPLDGPTPLVQGSSRPVDRQGAPACRGRSGDRIRDAGRTSSRPHTALRHAVNGKAVGIARVAAPSSAQPQPYSPGSDLQMLAAVPVGCAPGLETCAAAQIRSDPVGAGVHFAR
jgi:hypothetical protein